MAARSQVPSGFLVRGTYQRRTAEGVVHVHTFDEALELDVERFEFPLIEATDDEGICFLDLDTHSWPVKPGRQFLEAIAADLRPAPYASWTTHGQGLRAVFVADEKKDAELAAAIAALGVPTRGFKIELLRTTRHPNGAHPNRPGAECGPVDLLGHITDGPPGLPTSDAASREVGAWLDSRGMAIGDRYPHHACPIAPQERGIGEPVAVYDWGIRCWHCRGHARRYPGQRKPGDVPFSQLVAGNGLETLSSMARERVHWEHARIVLQHRYQELGLSESILRLVYERALLVNADTKDPRLRMVFNPDLQFVRSEDGHWLSSENLRTAKCSKETFRRLPWCLKAFKNKDGEFTVAPSGPRLDQAADVHPLRGYPPIRPIRGALLRPDAIPAGVVPVTAPWHSVSHPVNAPLGSPMAWKAAFSLLEETFPGISEEYVLALLYAVVCSEPGRGRPVIVFGQGPSGSGKGATVDIVNGIIGGPEGLDIDISQDEDAVRRGIGARLSQGARFLRVPEIGKVPWLHRHLGKLLGLSQDHSWKPHYQHLTSTPFTAPLVLNALTPPEALLQSPEACRRIKAIDLPSRVPEWDGRCPEGLTNWRNISGEHAKAADSLITHAMNRAREVGYRWDLLAQEAGLRGLEEEDGSLDRGALIELYEHCCGRHGQRELSTSRKYPGEMGWVDLRSQAADGIVIKLLPDHEETNSGVRSARRQLRTSLEGMDWPRVLGIPDGLPIRCQVRLHGAQFVGRFSESNKPRGEERRNENLPSSPRTAEPPSAQPTGRRSDKQEAAAKEDDTVPTDEFLRVWAEEEVVEPSSSAPTKEIPGAFPGTTVRTPLDDDGLGVDDTAGCRQNQPENRQNTGRILAEAGYPENALVLDFETYFDRSYRLGRMSVHEYVHHDKFHVHGLGILNGGVARFETDVTAALAALTVEHGEGWPDLTVVMHNAPFDLYILEKKFGAVPAHVLCTLAMARAVHGRGEASLEKLAKKYQLGAKGKLTTEGHRILSPSMLADLTEYTRLDVRLTQAILERLLPELPRPGVELRLIEHTVRAGVERAFAFDRAAAEQLQKEVDEAERRAASAAGASPEDLRSTKRFADRMKEALAQSGRELPVKRGKRGDIPALKATDPFMLRAVEDDSPVVRALALAKVEVGSAAQTRARIENLQDADLSHGGIPPVLKYFGGHTGRWSSDGSLGLQTIPSRGSGVNTRIRGLLAAQPGHLLIGADLRQIEARVLAWLAEESELLEAFQNSERDVYSEFGTRYTGEQINQGDPLRGVFKQAVLGLGYRMGPVRFWETISKNPDVQTLIESGTLGKRDAVRIVKTYRHTYPRIVQLWTALEGAALNVVEVSSDRDVGALSVSLDAGGRLVFRLPSSRVLRYSSPVVRRDERTVTYWDDDAKEREFSPSSRQVFVSLPKDRALHGGLITENVVQATARDLLAEAILRIEDRGVRVLLHIHDEVICVVREDEQESGLEIVKEEMVRAPRWAQGLPLAVNTWSGKRLAKG